MDAENKWGRLSPQLTPEVHAALTQREYTAEKGRGWQAVYAAVACPGEHPRDADYRKLAEILKKAHEEFDIKGTMPHPMKCMGTCLNGKKYVLSCYFILTPAQAKKFLAKESEAT